MINRKTLFEQPVQNNFRTYDSIRKITAGWRDDYTTVCSPNFNYFLGF